MNELERAVGLVLRKYMSEISAQSVRQRAQRSIGIAEGALDRESLPKLRRALETGIRLFVDGALQGQALEELDGIEQTRARPADEAVPVTAESDVSRARLRARELALALGASPLAAQRAATVVSELARNIVAYAGSGVIELLPSEGPPRELGVRATDDGPGIEDVEAILSGRYRSRTGLGKGLLGVKRLSSRFEIESGPRGTRVDCSIAF